MRYTLLAVLLTILSFANYAQPRNRAVGKPDTKLLDEARMFEKGLLEALKKGDRTALVKALGEGFIFIHSTGPIETRDEYIKNASAGSLVMQRTEMESLDEQWTAYAGNTVVRYSRVILRNKAAGTESRMRNINVYVKANGRWQWVSGQSTKLPARPKPAAIDARVYDDYAGQYVIGADRNFSVTKESGGLVGVISGRSRAELVPTSERTFLLFNENNDFGFMETKFVRDAGGKVSEIVIRQNGQELWRARRVK